MSKYIGIHCTYENGEKIISILKDTGIITTGYSGKLINSGYYILDTGSKKIVDCLDSDRYGSFVRKESCVTADMRVFNLDFTLIKEIISRSIDKSIIPFLYKITASGAEGGFDWSDTPEGHMYWRKKIIEKTESETDNKSEQNENQLQNKTVNLTRGERNTGRAVCYRQSKTTVTVGYLSHQEISC